MSRRCDRTRHLAQMCSRMMCWQAPPCSVMALAADGSLWSPAGCRQHLGWLPSCCTAYRWPCGTASHPGFSSAGAVPRGILCSRWVSCPPPAQPSAGLQRAGGGMPLCPGPGSPHSCAGGHLGWRSQVGLYLPACLPAVLWILGVCNVVLHYCLPCMPSQSNSCSTAVYWLHIRHARSSMGHP